MKYFFTLLLFFAFNIFSAQTIFWAEGFGNGCNQGQLANGIATTPSNSAWSVISFSTGPGNGTQYNDWFISAAEAGQNAGVCGTGCAANASLTNRTLHIGSSLPIPNLDLGAIYTITPNSNSNKLAMSGTINCTNWANMQVSFIYLAGGNVSDYAELMYYDGIAWNSVIPLANTEWTCFPKGMWTSQSVGLPASANNNPNVRIGFRWQNNSGNSNSDSASVAIDDIVVSGLSTAGLKTNSPVRHVINLYPNPAKDELRLDAGIYSGELSIEFFNAAGQKISETKINSSKHNVNIGDLAEGIYFLKCRGENFEQWQKLVKLSGD